VRVQEQETTMADLTVTRNDDAHRYEGHLGEDTAIIDFRRREDGDPPVVVMTHTEVPDSMRGEGVGGELVRQALDDVRARGEAVVAECPFVASWVEEHPDYQDLLADTA
jgi:uncharacterized protein